MFFLDRGLLAMGNLSFLMGVIALIGLKNTFMFFGKKSKIQGSVFYFLGFVMIVIGWYTFTFLGFIAQMYGLFLLFRQFISTIFGYSQTLPVIGPILRTSPFIQRLVERMTESDSGKKKAKYDV
ncbi:got1 family protein [Stylonychia lemnae]|uniref:Got1 family protein n=1 Tax=Stylonychia lemnae TaxID=5949 RepID=A0A078AAW1_STYLE|nr:got1 family protein [Stylonychia lemnae]|eukprot:CDW78991.1 got1 family protein [Stylonychia lemnae]